MSNISQSTPLFERSCNDVLSRLEGDLSEKARVFVAEAHDLLAILDGWRREVPTNYDRAEVISRVLDLHRAVMEHVTTASTQSPPT